jgi:NDP-sugar pyrophosphorylase family protein
LVPAALLPVVNKPIVAHLIELLVQHNLKSLTLVLSHMPYETETYLGDGSKWGVSLSYALPGSYSQVIDVLKRFGRQFREEYLCLPMNMVTDLNITQFIAAHREGGGDITLVQPASLGEGLTLAEPDHFSGVQVCPMILTPQALAVLFQKNDLPDIGAMIQTLTTGGLTAKTYHAPCAYQLIDTIKDYSAVTKRILCRDFTTLAIPGKEISPGLWIGRNVSIHPEAELIPPLLIGHSSIIKKRVSLAQSVIGDRVMVDQGAVIHNSIILDETYVGTNLDIKEMVIKKTFMLQVPSGVHVCVSDEVILGDLQKRNLAGLLERLGNLGAGLGLLVLTLPFLIPLLLYSFLFPGKKFLSAEKCYRPARHPGLAVETELQPFILYSFRSNWRLIQKLPGLFNVIKGDLNLVGNSPVKTEQLKHLPKDWEKLRFQAPAGLFHIWEAEGADNATWKEKMVMEGYYAASRSYWGDIKILMKSIFSPPREDLSS